MNGFPAAFSPVLILALLFGAVPFPAHGAAIAEPGWQALLDGHHDLAEEQLAACLEEHPDDLDCAIGRAALAEARGDFDLALASLAGALRSRADTPMAAAALARILVLASRSTDGGLGVRSLLEAIVDGQTPTRDPEVRSLALLGLADVLARSEQPLLAYRRLVESGGRVENWTLLGPYGRIPSLALDQSFPPDSGDLDPTDESGPGNLPPRRLDVSFADGRVVLPYPLREGAASYALTDLTVATKSTVRVRVDANTSFEVFIDGQPVARVDRWRKRPPHAIALEARFEPGRHRLMIKLATAPSMGPLAVTLETISGPPPRPVPVAAAIEGRVRVAPMPVQTDAAFSGVLPPSPARFMAAAWWLKARGLDREVGAMLQVANERWPDAALFTLALGEFFFKAETGAAPAEDLARGRTLIEQALEADPELLIARLLLAQMDRGAGRTDQARRAAEQALEHSPDHPDALLLLYQLAMERQWYTEAEDLITRARLASPVRGDLLDAEISYWRARGNADRLHALLERSFARHPLDLAWPRLLHQQGLTEQALEAWNTILDLRETTSGAWLGKARTLQDAGRLEPALDTLAHAARLFPDSGWVEMERAGILAQLGQEDAATEAIERALLYEPQRLSLRDVLPYRGIPDRLRPWLVDAASVLERAQRPGPNTDSALLADIAATLIDRKGGQTELYQGIHGVYTRAGVEHEGELQVLPGGIIEAIRLHKPDGKVVDVAPGTRRPVSLPGLAPGDSIEYVWRRYTPPLEALPGALDNRTVFLFQGDDRDYVLSRFVVVHDADLPVEACGNVEGLERTDEVIDGMRVRSWTAREMPRQYIEPFVPNRLEFTPHLRLGLGLDWATVGRLYRGALVGRLRLDDPLPAMLDAIRAQAPTSRPDDLARAMHRVILERVRPGASALLLSSPASMAASAGEGDRVGIALALARALNLEPQLVLTRSMEYNGFDLDCPSPQTFGYALVRIRTGDRWVYLDYTDADHPYGVLPAQLDGSDGLAIPLTGSASAELIHLPRSSNQILQEQVARLRLEADGRVSGEIRLLLRGSFAAMTRRLLRDVPREKMPLVRQSLVDQAFPGAVVEQWKMEGLEDPEAELVLDLHFTGGNLGRPTAAGLALPMTTQPLALIPRFGSLPARRYPMLFAPQAQRHDRLEIVVPEGYRLERVPEPFEYQGKLGHFSLSARLDAGKLIIERSAAMPPLRIEPEQYAEFRQTARSIDDAEARELLVTPVAQ